jgi:pimeloyl-ACP methyl ester carboxylesterase
MCGTVHLIPGLGADHRLFVRIALPGCDVVAHDHPRLAYGATLRDFAAAYAERIGPSPLAIVGMSMGGMIAQELQAMVAPQHLVLLSTWTGPTEMPPPLKLLRGTHPERLLTRRFLDHILPMVRWQMGAERGASAILLDRLVRDRTLGELKAQINAVMAWDGCAVLPPVALRLHGDKDRLMPARYLRPPVELVKGGSHMMVLDHGAVVSARLEELLGK